MTQALNLNEDQAAKIYPMINRIEKEKVEIQKNLAKDLQDLRKMLRSMPAREAAPDADRDARCRQAVLNISESRRTLRMKEEELEVFLEKNLTPFSTGPIRSFPDRVQPGPWECAQPGLGWAAKAR